MKRIALAAVAAGLLALVATPALADTQPTARDIEAAVDTYLASAERDASLVGGPGSAGYDSGFWIRGGDFSLRINLTLQARYEYFNFNDDELIPLSGWTEEVYHQSQISDLQGTAWPGGDLSGFSLPRAVLKFSGTAPCNIRYYAELDFGHHGATAYGLPYAGAMYYGTSANRYVFLSNWYQYSPLREAWIEWGMSDAFNIRMGDILYPNARQLMTPPELQQFVDISMASSVVGALQPGWTDRNRDYGIMIHGAFGCRNEWQYMFAATNGDGGDGLRNVTNPLTSDNLMYSGRINWAFLEPIGYTEGATRFQSCVWYGEIGLWGSVYYDRLDKPHTKLYNRIMAGMDLALGYGGFSMTGSFGYFKINDSDLNVPGTILPPSWADEEWLIAMVQLGYLFPDTPWEIAARASYYNRKIKTGDIVAGDVTPKTTTFAGVVNYYLNGHGNKLQLDFTWISAEADGVIPGAEAFGAGYGGGWYDPYAGVPLGFASNKDHFLVRFQWQLAL